MALNFGFITAALKTFGKQVLPLAEDAGVAAANAALPGVGGTLASLIITGITAAVAKHGTAPASTPAPSDPTITVGEAKKFDVMQFLESNAPDIMDSILAGRNKTVIDRAGFVAGTDKVVEGFLDIMKSIGAIPSSTPPSDPVVITPAVIAATKLAPAPAPTTVVQVPATAAGSAPFVGVVSNLESAKSSSPLDLAALLEQAAAQLRGK